MLVVNWKGHEYGTVFFLHFWHPFLKKSGFFNNQFVQKALGDRWAAKAAQADTKMYSAKLLKSYYTKQKYKFYAKAAERYLKAALYTESAEEKRQYYNSAATWFCKAANGTTDDKEKFLLYWRSGGAFSKAALFTQSEEEIAKVNKSEEEEIAKSEKEEIAKVNKSEEEEIDKVNVRAAVSSIDDDKASFCWHALCALQSAVKIKVESGLINIPEYENVVRSLSTCLKECAAVVQLLKETYDEWHLVGLGINNCDQLITDLKQKIDMPNPAIQEVQQPK